MDRDKFIPSMFHRRLLLLLAAFVSFVVVLSGQMVRLSVVEGAERLAAAEAKLDRRTFLPTYRGRILDRQGRVLAMDRASSDIAVEYDVIVGTWPRKQARRYARDEMGRAKWNSISPSQRDAAANQHLPEWKAKSDRLWREICRLGHITPDELQQRLDAIKASVQSTAASVWERQLAREQIEYGITEDEFKPMAIEEQRDAHVVLPQVPDEVAFAFRKLAQEMPGMVEVQDSSRREYPWLSAEVSMSRIGLPRPIQSETPQIVRVIGVGDHIIGSMRNDVWESDQKRRPFRDAKTGEIDLGWYQRGDKVGARGVERVFEDVLRGKRGEIRERMDTGEQIRIEPAAGGDLHLTLDIALQARVQAALMPEFGLTQVQPWHRNTALPIGTPLNAAAVVVEIQTGEILAMVSTPTIAMGELMSDERKKATQPIVNRPVEAIYPPGSIIKPLVLAAAVAEGLQNLDSGITCTGHYFADKKDAARCWIYREQYGMLTHGSLHAAEALARSCNIFFYTLSDRLGMRRLVKWYAAFGLGQHLDVGLLFEDSGRDGKVLRLGESAGSLPSEEQVRTMRDQMKFTEVIMGIGQGPIAWTPLQAANAYATIARGGTVRDATIVPNDPRGSRDRRCDDLRLKPQLVEAILEGLRQAVMERHGTGNHITYAPGDDEPIINAVGVQVWAKTGTAQADKARGLDHSWFVGMVGPKDSGKPMHAIAVLVENGGSGGRTAGPVANQIVRALQAEGYLPGDPNATTGVPRRGPGPTEPEPHEEE